MQIYTSILQSVSEFLGVPIGQLPESGGIAMELAPSSSPRSFMGGDSIGAMSILLLSKSKSQKNALDRLCEIVSKSNSGALPIGDGWEINTITVATAPNYVGQEKNENGVMWIYSAIITVNFYKSI